MAAANTTLPSANAVADFFLQKIDAAAGDSITNLKLQKLVYYGQAWMLALKGRPLFHQPIQAWAHGPVVPALYGRFASYGWQGIDPSILRTNPNTALGKAEREVLEDVWLAYGDLSGAELEALTHSEAPWREAYGDRAPGSKCTEVISLDSMKKYYKALLNAKRA